MSFKFECVEQRRLLFVALIHGILDQKACLKLEKESF